MYENELVMDIFCVELEMVTGDDYLELEVTADRLF